MSGLPGREGFTIGVEEEYHLIDPVTSALRHAPAAVATARTALGAHAQTEISGSQLEVTTPVCSSLADVRRELVRARAAAAAAAGAHGCRVLATATHPFGTWRDQRLTPEVRYLELFQRWGILALQQTIVGCHVHVGVADPELAVAVMDRARPHLPLLLAMSASSPFFEGHDTGYASYRTPWFSRWPVNGPPPSLGSLAAYEALVARLVTTGIVDDASHLYWDLRPSLRWPTLEFRVADVCTSLDDAVLQAALARSLVRTLAGDVARGLPAPSLPHELLTAARWQAARRGLTAELVDPRTGAPEKAPVLVEEFLGLLRPDLEEGGDWEEVRGLTDALLARGTSAARQRRLLARSGGDLAAVAAAAADETAGGAPAGTVRA